MVLLTMKRFIIWGAGRRGRRLYDFLKYKGLQNCVYCFVDAEAASIKYIDEIKVLSFEETVSLDYPYFISVLDSEASREIEKTLKNAGKEYYSDYEYLSLIIQKEGEDMVSFNRDFCAFFHINSMDAYFERAEQSDVLQTFWSESSSFYKMFKQMDTSNIIELACGRGRHVSMYDKIAGHITLVDILDKNIEYCKKRFKDKGNISYYCNNGTDLSDLADSTYTSLFTYDAMVHFELLDIASYLKEFYRVLKAGSYVLVHHSNNTSNYKVSFENGIHGRNYMSRDIFAYLAYRNGFEIVRQEIIDWGGQKDLDCISFLKKP